MNIARLGEILLHFLFPVSCEVCGKPGTKLCPECVKELPDEIEADVPARRIPSLFDGTIITRNVGRLTVYSAAEYTPRIRRVIHTLKTSPREIGQTLGKTFAGEFGRCEADYLLPVPLHLDSKRSYNHAKALAEGMSEVWGTKIIDGALWTRRIRGTDDLTHYDFRLTKLVDGRRIALVDDVCITGRTLSCLAEACRHEGAVIVCAYTLACDTERITSGTTDKTAQPSETLSPILEQVNAERYAELYKYFEGEIITRSFVSLTVYSAANYHTSGIREEIHKCKYSGAKNLCIYLGKHTAEKLGQCRADYLLPVPLHMNSGRAYNQSLELAKGMRELWDAEILDVAEWTREVPRRAASTVRDDLKPSDFRITQDIRGKHIALIDDVCTSGNTLNALASACRNSGAIVVCAYTLASV